MLAGDLTSRSVVRLCIPEYLSISWFSLSPFPFVEIASRLALFSLILRLTAQKTRCLIRLFCDIALFSVSLYTNVQCVLTLSFSSRGRGYGA